MSGSRDPLLRLPSWLIAASLVVLVVATLTYFITSNNDNTDEAAPSTPSPSDTSGTRAPDDSEAADKDGQRPDASKGDEQKNRKPDAKRDDSDKPADKKPKKQPQRQPPPETAPDATVDVYNNAGITNLAASASADVRGAGFTIGGVDNWYGSIPETTVYYPSGMAEQARLLADDLGVSRTMPAISPMSAERLSLILTAAL